MVDRKTLFVILLMVLIHGIKAQITHLELASGYNKTDFTSFSIRPTNRKLNFLSHIGLLPKKYPFNKTLKHIKNEKDNSIWSK